MEDFIAKFIVHSSHEDRKYNCKECGKAFASNQTYGHMNMHLGLKPQNPSNRFKKVHSKQCIS